MELSSNKNSKITIAKSEPWSVTVNYEYIINRIIERNGSIPDDVRRVLEELDREQIDVGNGNE